MAAPRKSPTPKPVGQNALREMLGFGVPQPRILGYLSSVRRTEVQDGLITEYYPQRLAPQDTPLEHLRFALKHEAFDLGFIVAALEAVGSSALEDWVRAEPTGAYSRRAWFLFETFTGRTLDLEAVRVGNYVAALDEEAFFVGTRRNSSRHRVADNLLGTTDLCPTVRRTDRIEAMITARLDQKAQAITARCNPVTLARAVSYLYTKETRSSFDIEHEKR